MRNWSGRKAVLSMRAGSEDESCDRIKQISTSAAGQGCLTIRKQEDKKEMEKGEGGGEKRGKTPLVLGDWLPC